MSVGCLFFNRRRRCVKRKRQISVKSKVHRILEAYFEELVLGFLGFESDWGNNNRLRVKEKTPTYEALKAEAEKAAKPFFKELLKGLKAPTEAARRAAQKEYTRAFREVIDDNIRAKAYEDAERFMETIVAAERDKRNALLEAALGIQELAAEAESEET